MKSSNNRIALWILILLLLISCSKRNLTEPSEQPFTLADTFEIFWRKMSSNYLYWDAEQMDWDEIYKKYKPLFATLDINKPADVTIAFNYLKEITSTLIDSHYSISFSVNNFKNLITPGDARITARKDFHRPVLYQSIVANYLDKDYLRGEYITDENERIYSVCGTINSNILYFSCSQFGLTEAYMAPSNGVQKVLAYFVDKLKQTPPFEKIVIDLRNNPGGDTADLNFLWDI